MGIFNPDNKGIIKISSIGNTRLSSLTDDFMKRLGYVRCDKDGTPLIKPLISKDYLKMLR
uniref:Uncharacterized protein n=1 Tax=Lysinibacillus sphaericus TaxID=1421 RepID=A0A6G9ZZR0_LYSSH|nr:hypothetical protein [Lysinibacillus sphaericus]QIS31272.1 hypothetical protein [Lysinibacillus sphaericus]